MGNDRKIKRDDFGYLYSNKIACCKWLDRPSVTMLFCNVKGTASKSTVLCYQKEWGSKIQVPRPEVIKMYNKWMGWVDLIGQRAAAYHFDRKSIISFYFYRFFDLMDVAWANSYIVYNKMHPSDLILHDFKTIVSTYLIGRYACWSRAEPDSKAVSRRKYKCQLEQGNLPPHLPEFRKIWNK